MKLYRSLSIALLCCVTPAIRAQYEQAAITGIIRDPQGRAIPEARVQIKQVETDLIRTSVSTSAGIFFLNGLPLGTYTFVATHDGFREIRVTDIRLAVGQTRTMDITLLVAQRTEELSVTTHLSEIDQASAAIGNRIQQLQVNKLPLNGRNWASMLP